MNLKKHLALLFLVSIYALILMHNLTPHCHDHNTVSESSSHNHSLHWWNLLLNHHPEGAHGDDEIVKFLRASDDEVAISPFNLDLDGPLLTLPQDLPSVEELLSYYSIAVPGKLSYLTVIDNPITAVICRFPIGRAPPFLLSI
jgi:hypothetical protein